MCGQLLVSLSYFNTCQSLNENSLWFGWWVRLSVFTPSFYLLSDANYLALTLTPSGLKLSSREGSTRTNANPAKTCCCVLLELFLSLFLPRGYRWYSTQLLSAVACLFVCFFAPLIIVHIGRRRHLLYYKFFDGFASALVSTIFRSDLNPKVFRLNWYETAAHTGKAERTM